MGPTGCPETSVRNYHYAVSNNPEERSSHLFRGGSLKSLHLKGHSYNNDIPPITFRQEPQEPLKFLQDLNLANTNNIVPTKYNRNSRNRSHAFSTHNLCCPQNRGMDGRSHSKKKNSK